MAGRGTPEQRAKFGDALIAMKVARANWRRVWEETNGAETREARVAQQLAKTSMIQARLDAGYYGEQAGFGPTQAKWNGKEWVRSRLGKILDRASGE